MDKRRIVQLYYQDPEKGLRKLEIEQPTLSKRTKDTKHYSSPDERLSDAHWRECVYNSRQAASRSKFEPAAIRLAAEFPGSLVFNTTVASVRIESDDEMISLGYDMAAIYDAAGDIVGHVKKAGLAWIRARESLNADREMFDCIVLEGGKFAYGHQMPWSPTRRRRSDARFEYWITNNESWELTIMLVERLPYKPFVARRVDIGSILVCLWNKCNPRWETVILC